MYLVEVAPGHEVLFKTVSELDAALRTGRAGNGSRIYHRATSSWIPISLHPRYRAITAEREATLAALGVEVQ